MISPQAQTPSVWRKWAWLPLPLFAGGLAVLWAADLRIAYESPVVLITLNVIFVTLVSLFVAYLCARSFRTKGEPGLVLLGCGVLVWGLTSGIAAAGIGFSVNFSITLHNVGVWITGLCSLMGAVLANRNRRTLRATGLWLTLVYTTGLVAVALVAMAIYAGWLPFFFIEGQGGTPIRQAVLGTAIGMLAVTSVMMWRAQRRSPSAFLYWYALGLALLAEGLVGVFIQSAHGSLLGWTSRAAQYVGGTYLLVAGIAAIRDAQGWSLSLAAVLRASEARLQALYASMTEGVALHKIVVNATGKAIDYRILDVNPAFERITGITREQAVAALASTLYGTGSAPYLDIYSKVAATGDPVEFETTFDPMGKSFHISVFSPAWGEFSTVFMDITERKRVADALAASEMRYRRLFESAKDGILILDADTGGIVDANPFLVSLLGYTRADFVGKQLWELGLFRDIAASKESFLELRAKGYVRYDDLPLETKEGRKIQVEFVSNVYAVERTRVIQCNIRDITERKQAARALRKAYEELEERVRERTAELQSALLYNRSLIETSLDPMVTIGVEGKITDVNAATEAMTGWTRKELIGADFLHYFTAPDKARAVYQKVFQEGFVRDCPLEIRHRDGHVTPVLYNASVYRDAKGEVVGVLADARDVTDHRRMEAESRDYQDRLRGLAEQLATSEEQERWQISRYIHDTITQNLSLSSMRLGIAQKKLAEAGLDQDAGDLHTTRKLVDDAIDECRTVMSELTPSLLYEMGLVPALRGLADTILQRHGIRVSIEDNGQYSPMDAPLRGLLFQSTRELIMNTLKHAGPCEVHVVVVGTDDGVLIRVQDNGKGFDPAHLNCRAAKNGGFGLFNVRERVEGMGGRLEIESAPDKGTTVVISLPVSSSC